MLIDRETWQIYVNEDAEILAKERRTFLAEPDVFISRVLKEAEYVARGLNTEENHYINLFTQARVATMNDSELQKLTEQVGAKLENDEKGRIVTIFNRLESIIKARKNLRPQVGTLDL